jgi:EAL domain-containing protein (putative c-di-GMP-specific phosphodiesterase class I)/GGDEF domain-containing protein
MEHDALIASSPEGRDFLEYLNSDRLRSFFQPIVDLYTIRIYGYEMLVRGEGELFTPAALFAKARKLGLLWELESACRKAAIRAIEHYQDLLPAVRFFINVSPDVFTSSRFQNGFSANSLRNRGVDVSRIVLELTETASVSDYQIFEEMIRHYVEQGFHIALDDFGAGHSGLITLVAVTPHFLKLDRELVQGIHRNHYKQGLVRHIGTFAESVGSHLLGEGIESTQELQTLYRLGARYGQGFLFGHPEPEPADLGDEKRQYLEQLSQDYHRTYWSLDFTLYRMLVRPETWKPGELSCQELDTLFSSHNSVSHVLVVDEEDKPRGLLTRQYFYSVLSGAYGFSVFKERPMDVIAKTEYLTVEEGTDLRMLGKLAMGRSEEELYDPVIIVDGKGALVGTITMKQLMAKAFDVEVKFAVSANPLTQLPGNMVIRVWLEELLLQDHYTIVYADLDKFKEYNDCYGFSSGDDMIKLLADVMQDNIQFLETKARLGHVGGDDFIILIEGHPDESFLGRICEDFDRRKEKLFTPGDVKRGSYFSHNRQGKKVEVPLVTVSLAVIADENFIRPPHPGKVGQSVAHLKQKIKGINAKKGYSGFLLERRIYEDI